MSSTAPAHLRAELVNPSKLGTTDIPPLHGFDDQFGQNSVAQVGNRKTRILIALGLSACVIGGLAFASTVNGGLHAKLGTAPTSSRSTERDGARETIDDLLRQMEALKGEIQQLQQAQQSSPTAAPTSSIEANQESRKSVSSVFWYSDPAALSIGIESHPDPWGVVPLPRPPAKSRPLLRSASYGAILAISLPRRTPHGRAAQTDH
jgi:hypothetical protein